MIQKFLLVFLGLTLEYTNLMPNYNKIHYVTHRYEHTMHNQQYLFYPSKNPKRLLISFAGLIKNKYSLWSWFWNNDEVWNDTAYLFLKDDSHCCYIGTQEHPTEPEYTAIISSIMKQYSLTSKNVFAVGGSLGASAALLYAARLNFGGVIAINPVLHKQQVLPTDPKLGNMGTHWYDLRSVIQATQNMPHVSLVYSYRPEDEAIGNELTRLLHAKQHTTTIVKRHNSQIHTSIAHVTKEMIEEDIRYFEHLNDVNNRIASSSNSKTEATPVQALSE